MGKRLHTGSRRNEEVRRAVLAATWKLLSRDGAAGLSIEAIAREAEVSRQTIYRWWPSRAAIVFEAARESSRMLVPAQPATDSLRGDLSAFVRATYESAGRPEVTSALRAMVAGAIEDEAFGKALQEFTAGRRALLAELLARHRVDPARTAIVVDLIFGVLWYRVINGHARLDRDTADAVVELVADAVTPAPRG
jgi:AcrR family transcriptional regulator